MVDHTSDTVFDDHQLGLVGTCFAQYEAMGYLNGELTAGDIIGTSIYHIVAMYIIGD